jgi:hypothetical protein
MKLFSYLLLLLLLLAAARSDELAAVLRQVDVELGFLQVETDDAARNGYQVYLERASLEVGQYVVVARSLESVHLPAPTPSPPLLPAQLPAGISKPPHKTTSPLPTTGTTGTSQRPIPARQA